MADAIVHVLDVLRDFRAIMTGYESSTGLQRMISAYSSAAHAALLPDHPEHASGLRHTSMLRGIVRHALTAWSDVESYIIWISVTVLCVARSQLV